jgi:two-component system, LytTR family, response regulator
MTTCVIIDDEPLAIEIIEAYLNQIRGTVLVSKFTDSVEAFTFLQQNAVDVVFLDLNMPMLNGMELLKSLTHKPAIIITTAYRDFAVESFEMDVLDYLVKPIAFPRFLKAIHKAIGQKAQPLLQEPLWQEPKAETANTLWLKVDKKLIPVVPQDILYVQSLKDYVRVVTDKQKLVTYYTLQAILEKLPATEFVRIHKSYIVQVAKVESIEGNIVHIKNETLPVGRNFRKGLLDKVEC